MKPVDAPVLVVLPERRREVRRRRTMADLPMIARKAVVLRERAPQAAEFIEHMMDVAMEELDLELPGETVS
jgi:hypothetical protein